MKTQTTLVPKLCKLVLLSALFLLPALHQARATSTNPCPVSALVKKVVMPSWL